MKLLRTNKTEGIHQKETKLQCEVTQDNKIKVTKVIQIIITMVVIQIIIEIIIIVIITLTNKVRKVSN